MLNFVTGYNLKVWRGLFEAAIVAAGAGPGVEDQEAALKYGVIKRNLPEPGAVVNWAKRVADLGFEVVMAKAAGREAL